MKIAYSLVSDGRDRYASMCYLSAAATRRLYPDAQLVLVTDGGTAERVREHGGFLRDVFDEQRVEAAAIPEPRARSFYIKTRLRSVLGGDFVYLDSDTLPVRAFDPPQGGWDVACVQDRNHYCPVKPVHAHWEGERLRRMGWQARLDRYFNCGVQFWRDTPAARQLAGEWQRLWEHSYALGDDWDQLAFNCAIERTGARALELPTSFNAMVTVSPVHARGAKVYHFFAGNRTELADSLYEHLIRHFESTRQVDWDAVDRCVSRDHPWMPPYWPRRLWETGNRTEAARLAIANLPGRLARLARANATREVAAR